MRWTIELSKLADRQLSRLDKGDQRLSHFDDPRTIGQALKGSRLGSFWRFRVGDYRLICDIQDDRIVILILEIGHRSDIYR